jgi:hypothetical protein
MVIVSAQLCAYRVPALRYAFRRRPARAADASRLTLNCGPRVTERKPEWAQTTAEALPMLDSWTKADAPAYAVHQAEGRLGNGTVSAGPVPGQALMLGQTAPASVRATNPNSHPQCIVNVADATGDYLHFDTAGTHGTGARSASAYDHQPASTPSAATTPCVPRRRTA